MTHARKKPAPSARAAGPVAENPNAGIDRVIRWCLITFVASSVFLGGIAWYAVKMDRVGAYLNVAGVIYVVMSTFFLGIMALVFVTGHLGTSHEIEAPKLELFDLEKQK
jgi:hypothetical protein